MTKEELIEIMRELAQVRPIFHSEADFQHELGCLIRSKGRRVRLERPFNIKAKIPLKFELDLEVDGKIAIELKYKKALLKMPINNEEFNLSSDLAFTNNRYDVVYDAKRVRDLVDQESHSAGFAIFLTNAEKYWISDAKGTKAAQFDLTGQKIFRKGDTWGLIDSQTKSRSKAINIGFYETIQWEDYKNDSFKNLEKSKNGLFRFLVIDVNKNRDFIAQ